MCVCVCVCACVFVLLFLQAVKLVYGLYECVDSLLSIFASEQLDCKIVIYKLDSLVAYT